MPQPKPLAGKDLRFMRKANATDTAPTYMGTVTTGKLSEMMEFDDSTTPNVDTPGALPVRSSVPKSYAWSTNVSGIFDPTAFKQMRSDMKAGVPLYVQIVVARSLANGGGRWDGAVYFENIESSYDQLGVVKFSAQLRGEGDLPWTDASA